MVTSMQWFPQIGSICLVPIEDLVELRDIYKHETREAWSRWISYEGRQEKISQESPWGRLPGCLSSPEKAPLQADVTVECYPQSRWLPHTRHERTSGPIGWLLKMYTREPPRGQLEIDDLRTEDANPPNNEAPTSLDKVTKPWLGWRVDQHQRRAAQNWRRSQCCQTG